jgi:hypothetical protein
MTVQPSDATSKNAFTGPSARIYKPGMTSVVAIVSSHFVKL